jgi:stearoyl-CoA desaturase (delta-9 desaturase)
MEKRSSLALVRWLDSYQGVQEFKPSQKWQARLQREDMVRCVPFILLHAVCLFIFVVGWSPVALIACVGSYLIRMFAITAFYHRYFSHCSFKTSRIAQFGFAFLGASSAQRGPLWWSAHHRYHHRHSDKKTDIHSPRQKGFWWSHMLWFMSERNFATKKALVRDWNRFPELVFMDRFDIVVPFIYGTGCFLFGKYLEVFHPSLGTTGWQMLIWMFFVSTILLYHGTFTINSLSHKWGKQRYKTGDDSRNNPWLALICLGEGWHNNHHHLPTAAQQGHRWWEIDISYYVLRLMSFLGIVWDLKPVPSHLKKRSLR